MGLADASLLAAGLAGRCDRPAN